MAKLEIKMPEAYQYKTKITLRVDDMNYGNHLGNDSVLKLCHEARIRFLNKHGQSELNCLGTSLIMRDARVVYKSQGCMGEEISISLQIAKPHPLGFEIYYLLKNEATGADVAHVNTGIIFFDYEKQKITKAPSNFNETFLN